MTTDFSTDPEHEPLVVETAQGTYRIVRVAEHQNIYAVMVEDGEDSHVLGGFDCASTNDEDLEEEARLVLEEAFGQS